MGRSLSNAFDQFEQKPTDPVEKDVNIESTQEMFTSDVNIQYKEQYVKKDRVEDTHERTTFHVRHDLNKRLNKLAKGKYGFKKVFINIAIERLLDEMEKK